MKTPLAEALPRLIAERGLTLRRLAASAKVDPAHLSRVIRARENKRASPDLARRLAVALDLPHDFFPEYRQGAVIKRLRADSELRDELYLRMARSARDRQQSGR